MNTFRSFITILLLFLLKSFNITANHFNCSSPWFVFDTVKEARLNNYNDSDFFQNWIFGWQHDCSNHKLFKKSVGECGLGCNINFGIVDMLSAFQNGLIYRPMRDWKWAANNSSDCTLNRQFIDCFSKPLSVCGTEFMIDHMHHMPRFSNAKYILAKNSFENKGSPTLCQIATTLRRPLRWVLGQFLKYFLRPKNDLQKEIQARYRQIDSIKRSINNSTSISCHVRGSTYDGRNEVNFTYYLNAIDRIAADFAYLNTPVSVVYVAAWSPLTSYISAEYMSKTYKRSWKYIDLPHLTLGGENGGDAEINLRNRSKPESFMKRLLYMEFLADIEIYSSSDAFIGTSSNMYPIVAALRAAKMIGLGNHSCYLDSHLDPPTFECGGISQFRAAFHGGFNDNSPF